MIEIRTTDDYDRLVPFFIENELEFSEEDPTPTDLVQCWEAVDDGRLIGGFVLAEGLASLEIKLLHQHPVHGCPFLQKRSFS